MRTNAMGVHGFAGLCRSMNAKRAATGHAKIDPTSISMKRRRTQLSKALFPRANDPANRRALLLRASVLSGRLERYGSVHDFASDREQLSL